MSDDTRANVAARLLLGTGSIAFLTLAVMMPNAADGKLLLPRMSWLWAFVLLPGVTGVANYIVTSRQRNAEPKTDNTDPGVQSEIQHRPKLREIIAAAVILTGVFGVVANAANANASGHFELDGLLYAGYGAYISTLWFMLVRLNANVLSPRFLINSALKSSIAMFIGYVVSAIGVLTPLDKSSRPVLFLLIGLFHSSAFTALRRAAMTTFGMTQADTPELSVRLLEGVDDGAVDVLEEIGITSIQHLATMHAPEVCGRSLYPRDRVLDWIDQSILVVHTNGRINELRALGIHSAYSLITVAHHSVGACNSEWDQSIRAAADIRVKEVAQRLGLDIGGFYLLAECIATDPAYIRLEEAYPARRRQKHAVVEGQPFAVVGDFASVGPQNLSVAKPEGRPNSA